MDLGHERRRLEIMFTRKKYQLFTVALLFLFLFASISPTAACTNANWTVKCNGRDVPVQYVWQGEEARPVYRFQIPCLEGGGAGSSQSGTRTIQVPCQGKGGSQKVTIYYHVGLRFVDSNLKPAPAPVPAPDPRPTPDPSPKPAPDPRQPPVVPAPKPKPQPPRPDPTPVPQPEPWLPEPDPVPAPNPEPQPGDAELSAEELQLLQLVNEERLKAGLDELKIHSGLVELARLKSKDMIALDYFDHQSPTYGSPFEMMQQAGIAYTYAGENLAGAPTVARAHTSLMNSPGHRANILNPNFTHVGIGIVDGGPYGKIVTQMFIKPR